MGDTPVYSGAAGEFDLEAEILVEGTQVSADHYDGTQDTNWKTLVDPGSGKRLKVYKVFFTISADTTGDFLIQLGSTTIGGVQNPKAGFQYILLSAHPNFVLGGSAEKLQVKGPSGDAMVDTVYEVITV